MNNKLIEELSLAMIALEPYKVLSLLVNNEFNAYIEYDAENGILFMPKHPIITIPIAWDWFIGDYSLWKVPERGEDLKKRNDKIKEIISSRLDFNYDEVKIEDLPNFEYLQLGEDYYYPEDRRELVQNGIREIDIDLYNAARRFDFDKVKELLDEGADPNVEIERSSILLDLTVRSSSELCDLEYHFLDNPVNKYSDRDIVQSFIFGACYERMWKFINEIIEKRI